MSRGRRGRLGQGLVAVGAAISLTLVGTVTPAEASPAEQARRLQSATLAEVREAARVQDSRVKAETQTPDPVATGTIIPNTPSTITADDLGVDATFSGNKVPGELDVAIGAAPAQALKAARSESPNGGAVVSDPVEITATAKDGKNVTKFPAKAVKTRGGGKKGPVVSDVLPGVALALKPDAALVKSSKVEPTSLAIYTRETAGEPWTLLPSYYDEKARVVRGESDHLSQFVVIGTPFPVPPGPRIVLDPDNDDGHVSTPAPPVTEWGYNQALASELKSMFENDCKATVTITNTGPNTMLSRSIRAGIAAAANPDVTLGIGFNTLDGVAWGGGDTSQGGTQLYSRGGALDEAASAYLVANMPMYTGRPANNLGNNGNFPGDEFAGLPNAFTHIEALFMDNNYDRAVIDNGFSYIVDGVFTGIGQYLQSQGFDCTDPVTGGWPTPPSAAELARWHELGYQNYQTYGGEPFSFSTGNLIEEEKLFTLPGKGGSSTDLSLIYNSQDGRLTRVGAGWSFGLGAKAQRFIDGSVLVERGDGASYVFQPDGHGGYVSEPGLHQTLTEAGGGLLRLTATTGESWVFDAADIDGIGELASHTDPSGNTTKLSYGAANPDVNQFVPLNSITDSSGQVITVSSDTLGRVTGFTRPDGAHWALAYDGAGNLTTVTLPGGRTHVFSYDGAHQLLTATDALGVTYLRNQYDSSGRIVKQTDADGNVRTLDYSSAGKTVYSDNLGRKSIFEYDNKHRITKITHPDATAVSFVFDQQNNVTSTTDENGNTTKYLYDGDGNVTQETAPDGAVRKYTYTPTGKIATVTDAGGSAAVLRTTSYDYNAAGQITAVHQPDGTTLTNSYDASGHLLATVKPSGATTRYGHDAVGHITSVTDPEGGVTRYAYDAAGRMTSQTDPNGNTTGYAWDAGDRLVASTDPAGGVTTYAYDANDHLVQLTDPTGAVTKQTWDNRFNRTSTTDALGAVTHYGYSAEDALSTMTDPLGNTTAFTLDPRDQVAMSADPNGGDWKQSHNAVGSLTSSTSPSGATTTYGYDAAGRITSSTDPTGATTTYKYDRVGRIVKTTDADKVSTSYGYDVMDRVTSVTDGLGHRTTFGYDLDGNLTSSTDRNAQVTAYQYDTVGRMVSSTSPIGDTTSYGYDKTGNQTSVTDPLGRVTTTTFTALNQIDTVTDPAGGTTTYTYDANGRVTAVTDAAGHSTKTTYDPEGRQVSTVDATGAVTRYGYDPVGNQTSTTDPLGNLTAYRYDRAAQLVAVVEGVKPGAKSSADANVTTKYGYDQDGNLTTTTDPNGHDTVSTFDKAGRTTSETNPVGNATRYEYTAAGRTASRTNGAGQVTHLDYNKRGDLTAQDLAGRKATYEYDRNQNLIAMTDPTGTTGWIYDTDGRQITQIDQSGGKLQSSYDKAGQLTGLKLPTGDALKYTYDQVGKVTSQSSPWGSLTYQWDQSGNLTNLGRSTGVATSYTYDPANRVTGILHQTPPPPTGVQSTAKPAPVVSKVANRCTSVAGYLGARAIPGAGSNNLCKKTDTYLGERTLPTPPNPVADGGSLGYTYRYDEAGNVTDTTRAINAPGTPSAGAATSTRQDATKAAGKQQVQSASYAYDALNRLTSSATTAGEKNTYGYDPAGNRTSWVRTGTKGGNFSQKATFNDAGQLTGTAQTGANAGNASYGYDAAGNRVNQNLGGSGTNYSYDPTGRTTRVSRDGRDTTYGYDGLGRQATSTDTTRYGTTTTSTVSNGTDPVQQTDNLHGTTTMMRDAAGSLAQHVTNTGKATWDLLDGLGSTIAGADGESITQLASYSDWGLQKTETDGWSAPGGFTGETSDPTQGLNHYYARSYDTTTGSWTAPDCWRGLLRQPQSRSRYNYVENNPSTNADLLGFIVKPQRLPPPPPPAAPRPVPPNPPTAVPAVPSPRSQVVGPSSYDAVQARHALVAASDVPPVDGNGLLGLAIPIVVGFINVYLGIALSLELFFYPQLKWGARVVLDIYRQAFKGAQDWVGQNVSDPIGNGACQWMSNWLGGMGIPATC